MSVQQEHATSETATLTTTESGGVYQSLFDKINLTPVSSIQEIDLWQNSETLADASPDERVTSNANFISQFVMGGDPCTYKESGELQAEMSKLTHPARPDVDWRRVEKLSLALFRQNGVELQTQVCYVLAITRRQGLAGMADGLGSLDILLQRWADFWPVQVHSRISLLSWVTEKMQQALRTLDIQYQDLPQIYRCVQHLSAIETTLQQC